MREAFSLPPLKLRGLDDQRRHPHHGYAWDTMKLNCGDKKHEGKCFICNTNCCAINAAKALLQTKQPGMTVKACEALEEQISQVDIVDPFETMLGCVICKRKICPQCAGRCSKNYCLRIYCKECGGPDP